MQHPSGIPEKIVKKVIARRGRLHAFETIDPKATALVVIDLAEERVTKDDTSQRMIPVVNALARAVRQSGGIVAWVLSRMNAMPKHFSAILGVELATRYVEDGQASPGSRLWHALQREDSDLIAVKSGASAFFPGKCNLKEQLDTHCIDRVLPWAQPHTNNTQVGLSTPRTPQQLI